MTKTLLVLAALIVGSLSPALAAPAWHHHVHHHVHRHRVHHRLRHHRHRHARHIFVRYASPPFPSLFRLTAPDPSRLLAVAKRFLGARNFTGHRGIPWCAAAVGSWLRQAGYASLRSFRAIDYLHYGYPTSAHTGALAVLRHHVGIVVEVTARGVLLLSGNHGHRVAYGTYPLSRILAFREPV